MSPYLQQAVGAPAPAHPWSATLAWVWQGVCVVGVMSGPVTPASLAVCTWLAGLPTVSGTPAVLRSLLPSSQVSSESSGGTFIYQGSVKGQGFGQFGFQRLGN